MVRMIGIFEDLLLGPIVDLMGLVHSSVGHHAESCVTSLGDGSKNRPVGAMSNAKTLKTLSCVSFITNWFWS